jgi:ParB-like chromosome segregation protein Spo0J
VASPVKIGFEKEVVALAIDAILPLRVVSPQHKETSKYRQIAHSVAEVGIIEPLVVAPPRGEESRYLLLDGHLRLAILIDSGASEVRCLISRDDEAFTYNKRINRLATIQEHYMIVRALERGVSEEKLAKALNLDVRGIKRRRAMLDGVCPEVIELLKDRSINARVFDTLKRMKPSRQIEAAELMCSAGTFTSAYAKALLVATRQADMMHPEKPKRGWGLTSEQMARLEREADTLNQDLKALEDSYGDDVLNLVVASGYVSRLLGNEEIGRYLDEKYPELASELRVIVSAVSLDQPGVMAA